MSAPAKMERAPVPHVIDAFETAGLVFQLEWLVPGDCSVVGLSLYRKLYGDDCKPKGQKFETFTSFRPEELRALAVMFADTADELEGVEARVL